MDSSPHSIALFLKMRGLVRQLAVMRLLEQSFRPYSFAPQSFLCFAISAILPRVWVFS